jgi:NADPH:quinone reductase-like Zn-dependent oxidoreductase
MKAILHTRYGAAGLLQLREVEKPTPGDHEILIAIHATTVSTADCNMRNFTFVTGSMRPFARLIFGIRKPWKARVLGTELAGEVEAVGKDVTRFKRGDRIVASTGMAGRGHAQYACLSERGALALKPASLSWEEAVAIPFGANTALYFLRHLGNVQPGQKLLIIGASGSIGSAAMQLAKHFGATVTAVCSGANAAMVTSLGADEVIDYTREDFTRDAKTYDLIFDIVGATTFRRCQRSLKPQGVFLQNIVGLATVFSLMKSSSAMARFVFPEARRRSTCVSRSLSKHHHRRYEGLPRTVIGQDGRAATERRLLAVPDDRKVAARSAAGCVRAAHPFVTVSR